MAASEAAVAAGLEAGFRNKAEEPGGTNKRLILIVIGAALLAIGTAAGAVIFTQKLNASNSNQEIAVEKPKPLVSLQLPILLVNLNSSGKRPANLNLGITLELASADDLAVVRSFEPRIVGDVHAHLRTLQASALQGSDSVAQLREDLLRVVSAVARPVTIRAVLFREMVVR